MMNLQMKMWGLVGALFAVIYAIVVVIGNAMGVTSFNFYLLFSFGLMFIQFLVGPKIVEWSMKVKYVSREEYPKLYDMVEDQARRADIPIPRVCISRVNIPNAFAFGRGQKDGRVCVTDSIMKLLSDDELKAVIGHEVSHLKNRDVLTITLLSVIPMIMYRVAWHFVFYGGGRRNDNGGAANGIILGLIAFGFYFVTNLLVLYASRIREYYADRGAVELGNRPEALASALYKLVYGSARMDKGALKQAEGFKAFFVNDPSNAMTEIRELSQLDLDRNGIIDQEELALLRNKKIQVDSKDRMMESLSTHPNMLKRIKHLSEL